MKIAEIIKKDQRNYYNIKITLNKDNKFKRNDFFYPEPSIKKIKKIGWQPKINARLGFINTINYFKKNKI